MSPEFIDLLVKLEIIDTEQADKIRLVSAYVSEKERQLEACNNKLGKDLEDLADAVAFVDQIVGTGN
jgi:hypothetical protein